MSQHAAKEAARARKRMLAAGRKINGTWEVRTFMRFAAGGTRETFWESTRRGGDAARSR